MKIALVAFRLSGGGGDRVMSTLSKFFSAKGFDVHIIIFHDELGYDYSGSLYNLGRLKSDSNTIFNKIKRFYYFNKYIKKQNFDFIIDFRFRVNILQELLINKWIYKSKTIYTVHSSKIEEYMPNSSLLTRYIYGNAYALVCITDVMKQMVEKNHKLTNLLTIYNPIDINLIQKKASEGVELDFEYIIAVGEFNTNIKQFDRLIEAYSNTVLPKNDIALVILGTGKLKDRLLKAARDCNVESLVHFLGFKNNPYKYIAKSRYLVLSSTHEGLPMVLLESLSVGTPLVAFDCLTGPSEIIIPKENGLIVENQNFSELTKAMNIMVEDKELYLKCKNNAQQSALKFSVETIGQKWLELMKLHN